MRLLLFEVYNWFNRQLKLIFFRGLIFRVGIFSLLRKKELHFGFTVQALSKTKPS